jgi:hypothetical protein
MTLNQIMKKICNSKIDRNSRIQQKLISKLEIYHKNNGNFQNINNFFFE